MTMFMKKLLSLTLAAALAFECICTAPLNQAGEISAASDMGVLIEGEIDDGNPEILNQSYTNSYDTFSEAVNAISSNNLINAAVYILQPYTVEGDELWSYTGSVSVSAPITVTSGASLTISDGSYSGLDITVNDGGSLVLNTSSAYGTLNVNGSAQFSSSSVNITNKPDASVGSYTVSLNGFAGDCNTRLVTFDATDIGGSVQTLWYTLGGKITVSDATLCVLCGYPQDIEPDWVYGEDTVWDFETDTITDTVTLSAREPGVSNDKPVLLTGTGYSRAFATVPAAIAAASNVENASVRVANYPFAVDSDQSWIFDGPLDVGYSYTESQADVIMQCSNLTGDFTVADGCSLTIEEGSYDLDLSLHSGTCTLNTANVTGELYFGSYFTSTLNAPYFTLTNPVDTEYMDTSDEGTRVTMTLDNGTMTLLNNRTVTLSPGDTGLFEEITFTALDGSRLLEPSDFTVPSGYTVAWKTADMADDVYWDFAENRIDKDITLTAVFTSTVNAADSKFIVKKGGSEYGFNDFSSASNYAYSSGVTDIYFNGTSTGESMFYGNSGSTLTLKRYNDFKGTMIKVPSGASLRMSDIIMDGGGASDCGGPLIEIPDIYTSFEVGNVTLRNNNNPEGNGGGILMSGGSVYIGFMEEGSLRIENCSAASGGGIYCGGSNIYFCSGTVNITGNKNSAGEEDNLVVSGLDSLRTWTDGATSDSSAVGLTFSDGFDYSTASTTFSNGTVPTDMFTLDKECGYIPVCTGTKLSFSPKEYTITYEFYDPYAEGEKTTISTQKYTYGTAILGEPAVTGRPAFRMEDRWYTDEEYTEPFVNSGNLKGDFTLYGTYRYYYDCFTFETNGGELDKGEPEDYGNSGGGGTAIPVTYFVPPTPTKEHYTFAGWYDNAELTGDPIESMNLSYGSISSYKREYNLYAKWEGLEYTDTYIIVADGYARSEDSSSTVTYTYPQETFSGIPVTVGWSYLDGWYTDRACTNDAVAGTDFYNGVNSTVYGINRYYIDKVTYETNGGTLTDAPDYMEYVLYEEVTLPIPTRENYDFAGWYEASDFSGSPVEKYTVTSSPHTFYAKWKGLESDIEYNLNYGTLPEDIPTTHTYGTVTTLPIPEKTHYTFDGWFMTDDFTGARYETIAADAEPEFIFYAKWTVKTYDISYTTNGGTLPEVAPMKYVYGNVTLLPVPTRSHYTFGGWYTNSAFEGEPVENLTMEYDGEYAFFAKWTADEYDITYTSNGGTLPQDAPTTHTYGTVTTLPVPTRSHYTFGGWYMTEDFSGAKYTQISGTAEPDYDFCAKWTAVSYTAAFELNGGSCASATPSSYSLASPLSVQTPSKAGYRFKGWLITGTGSNYNHRTLMSIPADLYGDVKISALWSKIYTPDRSYRFGSQRISFKDTSGITSPVIQIGIPTALIGAEDVEFEILSVTETSSEQIYTIRATGTVNGNVVTEDASFVITK